MSYVIANTATKAIIGRRKDGKYTLVFDRAGARGFTLKERAEKEMVKVVKFFGNDLPWEVIKLENYHGEEELLMCEYV